MLRTLRALSITLAACWLFPAADSAAERGAEMRFDIPAQSLDGALNAVAETAGVQLSYPGALSEGLRSPALSGRYTVDQALDQLLEGTGLGYRFVDDRTLTLQRPNPLDALLAEVTRPRQYAGAAEPPPKKAEAPPKQDAEEITVLPPITVTASPLDETSYTVLDASTATKTDTPLIETPVSVQTVPGAVIADRQYTRLQEALENVSGVVPVPSLGVGSRYLIRGFRQDRIYRDGLQSNGLNAAFPTEYDTATAESIEVLKGPASVLYGRIEPGGLINIVTKKPLASPYHSASLEGGSFDYWRTEIDSTGPLDDGGKWLYRLAGAWQESETFKDFGQDDRRVIAPSLTWRPNADIDFRVNLEYFERDYQADPGTPVIGTRPIRLPRERSFLDPNDPFDENTKLQIGTDFNFRFSDDWALRNRFLFGRITTDEIFINPAPAFGNALQADGRTLNRNIFSQHPDSHNYSTNLDVLGHMDLGSTEHQILLGADYLQGRTHYPSFGDFINPNPALAIDIFNPFPSYGIDPAVFESTLATSVLTDNHSVIKDRVYGIYFQDQIKIEEKLHVLLGGRYDWARTGRGRGTNEDEAEAAVPTRRDEAFSPRVAALYQFRPDFSGYFSWSRSFGANNGVSATGSTFDPQEGEQYEVGLKAELFDQRLLATLALYHLTKTNLLTPDLSTPDPRDSIAIGEQRARGVEIDVSGQITDQFNLIASYAYTDAEVTLDNTGLEGNRTNNVPKHALSLWGRYDFSGQSRLSGLSIGLGGAVIDNRPGDLANSFTLPGFGRLDAMLAYRFSVGRRGLVAQVNVRNLLDKHYFESTDQNVNVAPRLGVAVGAPRAVIASIKVEF